MRLWIKAIGAPKTTKFLITNLFNDGLKGAGELVAFLFIHIMYIIGCITSYMVYTL